MRRDRQQRIPSQHAAPRAAPPEPGDCPGKYSPPSGVSGPIPLGVMAWREGCRDDRDTGWCGSEEEGQAGAGSASGVPCDRGSPRADAPAFGRDTGPAERCGTGVPGLGEGCVLQAYELVRSHGVSGVSGVSGVAARLTPFTVDGLTWAASMAVLDASRQNQPVPRAGSVEPWRGHRCHGWRPTWRMASGMTRLVPWSAHGPPWRWSAAWVRRDGRG